MPLSTGVKVLALTVTEHGNDDVEKDHRQERLNEMMLNYRANNFYAADLASDIPYKSMLRRRSRAMIRLSRRRVMS